MAEKARKPVKDRGRKIVEKKANKLEVLKIEYVPVSSITPNSYNANRQSAHDFELLQKSMREDGFTQPIIVQQKSRQIVDGEHRWRSAQALGWTEVPVVFVDMTPEQMRISTLRHNRARGSEDIELTAQILRDLRELGALDHAQDSLMMDDVELQRMLEDVQAPEALASAEFAEAWEPVTLAKQQGDAAGMVAASAAASHVLREQEKRLEAAHTDEERAMVRKDTAVYRVSLTYSGAEGEIVKRVLGAQPAEALLALCQKADV